MKVLFLLLYNNIMYVQYAHQMYLVYNLTSQTYHAIHDALSFVSHVKNGISKMLFVKSESVGQIKNEDSEWICLENGKRSTIISIE